MKPGRIVALRSEIRRAGGQKPGRHADADDPPVANEDGSVRDQAPAVEEPRRLDEERVGLRDGRGRRAGGPRRTGGDEAHEGGTPTHAHSASRNFRPTAGGPI